MNNKKCLSPACDCPTPHGRNFSGPPTYRSTVETKGLSRNQKLDTPSKIMEPIIKIRVLLHTNTITH